MKAILKIAALVALMFGMASPAAAEGLSAAELQSEVIGQTLVGKRMGMTITMIFAEDGSANLDSPMITDTGVWELEGDLLCMDWGKFLKGERRCETFKRHKDGGYNFGNSPRLEVQG